MKQERDELINQIIVFIKGNIINENLTQEAIANAQSKDKLRKYFNPLLIDKIFKLNTPIETLDNLQLCTLTRYLKLEHEMKVDLSEWFTDVEQENSLNNASNIKDVKTLIFEDVIFNGDTDNPEFRCFVNLKTLSDIKDMSGFSYNPSSQRIGKQIKRGSVIATRPILISQARADIANLVAKEKYKSNDIIINMLKTDIKGYFYDKNTRRLEIDLDKTQANIIDGAHRYYGIYDGIKLNPRAEGTQGLTFINVDIEEAGEIVYQIAKANTHNVDMIEKYNPNNYVTQFIKKLNVKGDKENNFLCGKIDMYNSNENNRTIVKYETLLEVLIATKLDDKIMKSNIKERDKLMTFFVDFYTYFDCEFREKYPDKENILEDGTFICGLLYTLSKLYSYTMDVSINDVEDIVKRFNFDDFEYTFNLPLKDKSKRSMNTLFSNLCRSRRVK